MIPIEQPQFTAEYFSAELTPHSAYQRELHPWCVICRLPRMQRSVVARCHRRSQAEDHLKALQRVNPGVDYAIVFDPPDS